MDKTQKILIAAAAVVIVAGGGTIAYTLTRPSNQNDIASIHTTAAAETMPETAAAPSAAPETSEALPDDAGTASSVTATLETYTQGKVSIQYPAVDKMEDSARQEQVNTLLKDNALSILKSYGIDDSKDSLEVKCQVISVDRKRITATYSGLYNASGSAHPTNIFYSNTVNLAQVLDLGLSDFSDAYTMAGYVLSDDVTFSGLTQAETSAVLEYRSGLSLEELTRIFEGADFPLDSETAWPESFSYEKQGSICFSLPVTHALGDYVIVTFDPTTK